MFDNFQYIWPDERLSAKKRNKKDLLRRKLLNNSEDVPGRKVLISLTRFGKAVFAIQIALRGNGQAHFRWCRQLERFVSQKILFVGTLLRTCRVLQMITTYFCKTYIWRFGNNRGGRKSFQRRSKRSSGNQGGGAFRREPPLSLHTITDFTPRIAACASAATDTGVCIAA